jgi:hypothetical protein
MADAVWTLQAFSGMQWASYGSLDIVLPVILSGQPLAVIGMTDPQIFSGVYPQFSLDFSIQALRVPIINFLTALQNSNFDLAGAFVF